MRKCRFCHREIHDASTVCEHCGQDLFPGRTVAPVVVAPPPPIAVTAAAARIPRPSDRYCPNCGTVGTATTRVKGSFLIEVILWLCFLAPGLIYSVWRLTTKEKVCPGCGAANMIPVDSPKARAALAK